ncbi:siderophore iron transporter [Histoplasma capsulatum H143]|uniref:Siderophore iron transporter n=1 Tax=Ajellomyces capsulatus (strain H143) TaxID=544712 RepID=C6HR82_AJECH|nr:siderophore iron transporter [Histoplasma capsulatum H143]
MPWDNDKNGNRNKECGEKRKSFIDFLECFILRSRALWRTLDTWKRARTQPTLEAVARSSLHLWCRDAIFYCLVLTMRSAFLSKLQTHAPVAQPQVISSGAAKEAGDLPQVQEVASDAEDQLSADAQDGVLDIRGRPQGFLIMVGALTIGLVMMAACNNFKTYAAAQAFYWVGRYNGMSYTISIFIADTSALKNRALMFAFVSSPYIATVWVGGPLATVFLNGPGFRWGYGAFAIITPAITCPLRTFTQSLKHYFIEFDIIGIILLACGLALFLLPFSLYSYQKDQWRSSLVISMIIVGGLLLFDRTVLGACILAASLFVSFYIWDSYFSSFLQIANDLSITQASYIVNIYSIGACFWSIIVGILVRWSGRFKWLALYFGVPLTILGVALMITFRQPDVNIGYIIMCQIFIAFAGGTCVITEQMAVMAATSHQYVAVVLAVESMFANIGGAIGQTVAAAIWTGVFPQRLAEYLPDEANANATLIYGDLTVQKSYPVGSLERIAINRAYGDGQKYMLIGGTAILAVGLGATMMWRDIKVKDFKQVKGLVV